MPLKRCKTSTGKSGWKWGDSGKCYASKAAAMKQARAIEASKARQKKGKK